MKNTNTKKKKKIQNGNTKLSLYFVLPKSGNTTKKKKKVKLWRIPPQTITRDKNSEMRTNGSDPEGKRVYAPGELTDSGAGKLRGTSWGQPNPPAGVLHHQQGEPCAGNAVPSISERRSELLTPNRAKLPVRSKTISTTGSELHSTLTSTHMGGGSVTKAAAHF